MIKSTRLRSTLSASTILAAGLLLVVAPAQAQNLPDTANVSISTRGLSGGAPGSTDPGFSTSGAAGAQTLRVDLKDNRTILNWGGTGFNVAAGNTVDFKDARATAGVTGRTDNMAVLNRDLSGSASNILGTVKSDPNVAVYVINQSGILFGGNANVDTGAFFAGTSNLSDDNDFLNAAMTLRFSGSSGGTITANAGSQFTTAAGASSNGGRMGDLVMMGSQVLFRGTAGDATSGGAAGDVALIAATDAAITNTPGSPLTIQIYKGTALFNGLEVGAASTVRGRNVTLAYAQTNFASGSGDNVNIMGSLVATGAQVTDRGVVLSAGISTGNVSTDTANTTGIASINQVGNINSAAGVLSNGIAHNVYGTINAAGAIDFGGEFVSSYTTAATITGASVKFGQIVNLQAKVKATAGNVTSSNMTFFYGGVEATGDVVVDGIVNGFTLGAPGAQLGGTLKVNAFSSVELDGAVNAGAVDIKTNTDLQISKNITATGSVKLTAGSATITGAISAGNDDIDIETTGDLTVDRTGADFRARKLVSGGAMSLTAGNIFVGENLGNAVGPAAITATGDLTIKAADTLLVFGKIDGGSVNITQTSTSPTGYVEFDDDITSHTGDLTINAAAGFTMAKPGLSVTNLTSAGGLTIRAGDDVTMGVVTAAGNIDINSSRRVRLTSGAATGANADLSITGSQVGVALDNVSNSLSAGRDVFVSSTDFGSGFDARVFAGRNLTISGDNISGYFTANTGFVQLTGQQSIDAWTIKAATDVKINDSFGFVGNVRLHDVTAGNDIIVDAPNAMAQIISAKAGGRISLSGLEAYLGGDTVGGPTGIVTAGGNIDVSAGDQAVFEGSVSTDGNLTATGTRGIVFGGGATSAKGAVTLTAANGSIGVSDISIPVTLQSNSDGIGAEPLTLNALNGINLPKGSILAGTNRQSDLQIRLGGPGYSYFGTIQARSILSAQTLGGVLVDGLIVPTSSLNFFGPVTLTNGLDVRAADFGLQGAITLANGNLDVQAATGARIAGAINANDISVRVSSGDLSIMPGALFTGHDVVLSTSNAFVNTAGANIMNISGHWVVYSAYPNNDTFGGLDSGKTALWNATLTTRNPSTISGNRYVFAYQPTLTFSSQNASKVYGTDLTGSTGLPFAVTGYQPGVAGAFLGDSAATAYSGLPSFTSAGFTARARVAGGQSIITIGQGGLQGDTGYAFAFASNGILTITPKALTADVIANNKTYDGSAIGTGVVTLNGVVVGDTVDTVGTTFIFSDKNAGIGKTVTIANTALTGADASNYTFTIPASALADILKKALTASVTANNKTYDGSTTATGTVVLNGVVGGDAVGTSGTTFTFSDKNAGAGKTVAVAGTSLTGAGAGNYTLTVPASAFADILKKALTANVTADNKTYDGTTAATGTVTLNGIVSGDAVGTSGTTFAFASKNAGTGKTVNVGGTALAGTDAGNYTITVPASVLADILKKALTANVVANNKTYDGTTIGSGTVTLNGLISGDAVGTSGTTFTFGEKSAGIGKSVQVGGTTLTGADAGNYTVTVPPFVFADILRKAITVSVLADNKTYDGTTAGSGTVSLGGVVNGDTVGASGTTFTFTDKNAGTGKTVTVAGTTLTGADAGNYTFTIPAGALADILKKAITANVIANNKTYDGTTAGTGTVTLNGVVSGDTIGTSGTSFAFADKNAGTGKTVNVSGTALTGADAGNYTVTVPASALADILKKALTASVTANNKTYDGTRTGTGAIVLNGVVSGDAVGTGGTTFTFADKNAGTGKSVAVAGTSLAGADAANYTVTVPASALADILKKAITANIVANNKTYDGTTAATGTVTLNGLVTGDAVTTSGTTFTFADKNAGIGKAVAVAGTTIGGADAGNYSITIPASALGDILKRALAVTADDASKVQNDPDPALTFTLNSGSLVAGDVFSGGVARDTGENPGTYAIRIGALSAGNNYTITFTPGTFTINLPLGSEGLQPALKAQPLPSQLSTDQPASSSSVDLQTSAVCGDDKNCTTGNPSK
jgi:filamentous hemagglutinin family protein